MKILFMILLWDIVLGTAMLGYIWLSWMNNKNKIATNGWKPQCCTPFAPTYMIFTFYIPVIGFVWYFVTGEMIATLSTTERVDENQIVEIEFLHHTIFYTD